MTTPKKTKRSGAHLALWIVGGAALVGGLVALGAGFWLFGSAFMTPSSTFFADPEGTMDRTRTAAFLGVALFGIGATIAPVGVLLTIIAAVFEVRRSPRVTSPG